MLDNQTSNQASSPDVSVKVLSFKGHLPNGPVMVEAISYNQAASMLARKVYGPKAKARRLAIKEGFDAHPGYYQAYFAYNHRKEIEVGDPFYVTGVNSKEFELADSLRKTKQQLAMAAVAD